MHLVTLATTDGHVAQRSTLTAGQKSILAALELPEPARFFDFSADTILGSCGCLPLVDQSELEAVQTGACGCGCGPTTPAM